MGAEAIRTRFRSKSRPTPRQVVRPVPSSTWRHEVHVDRSWVQVLVSCPDASEEDLRYAIGRRYVVVWTDTYGRPGKRFISLPRPVDPDTHEVKLRNGVLELTAQVMPRS